MFTHLPETFAATCCQVIRDRRQRLGVSQEDLSRRSGLARSYICDVERGARHPSLRNVSTLSRALELPTFELISQVELYLSVKVDIAALKEKREVEGLHSEIIRYYNERMTDGLIIADRGETIFFNSAAAQIIGLPALDRPASQWPELVGIFKEDGVTRAHYSELCMSRVLSGEAVDDIRFVVKNNMLPNGRGVRVSGRPVRSEAGGSVVAGAIILKPIGRTAS